MNTAQDRCAELEKVHYVAKHATRREAREKALQFLYGLEFTHYEWDEGLEAFWENYPPSEKAVRDYAEILIEGVFSHSEAYDKAIAQALDHWSPERVGSIERTAIRMALFEMTQMKNVPPPVAINEAINVVKAFGGDDAPRFVNGVLDRMRKKLEEDPALLE